LISSLAGGKRDLRQLFTSTAGWLTTLGLNLLSRRKRLKIYSIQMLKRRHPDWFRQDLTTLFDLLRRGQLKPIVDRKLPLEQAALGQELLVKGGTVGKIVLVNEP
jgi:NADPH2:quinone reductase